MVRQFVKVLGQRQPAVVIKGGYLGGGSPHDRPGVVEIDRTVGRSHQLKGADEQAGVFHRQGFWGSVTGCQDSFRGMLCRIHSDRCQQRGQGFAAGLLEQLCRRWIIASRQQAVDIFACCSEAMIF